MNLSYVIVSGEVWWDDGNWTRQESKNVRRSRRGRDNLEISQVAPPPPPFLKRKYYVCQCVMYIVLMAPAEI